MNEAAKKIYTLKGKAQGGLADCGISDVTWQRRGFCSLDGRVSAVSIATGKAMDVEVLSWKCMTSFQILIVFLWYLSDKTGERHPSR